LDVLPAEIAPDGGGGAFTDILSNPAITTPSGFALAVLMYLAKLWRDSRAERRADNAQSQTRESLNLTESKDILQLRREEAADLRAQAKLDRETIRQDRRLIEELETRVARLVRNNEALLEQVGLLRETLRDGIGQKIEDSGAQVAYRRWRNATDSTDPSLAHQGGDDGPVAGSRPGPGAHRRGAG
jgi:hypothetical protein